MKIPGDTSVLLLHTSTLLTSPPVQPKQEPVAVSDVMKAEGMSCLEKAIWSASRYVVHRVNYDWLKNEELNAVSNV